MNFLKQSSWKVISATGVALMLFLLATPAHAATLTLSSNKLDVTAGDIVTVSVLVNSSDQAINAAEGTLEFPSDMLEALSIDKSSSIFSIWVEDPSFSNSTGEVDFSGGLPTPGYQGSAGNVLNVSFLAKNSGTATLSLADAEVNANDGMGTNVLTSTGTLSLNVTSPAPAAPVTTTSSAPTNANSSATPSSSNSDTTPPTISSSSFTYATTTGMLTVSAKAKDSGSGIEGYSVSVDNGPLTMITPADFASDTFQLPVHTSGTHTVLLTVTDNAGNKTSVSGTFTVPTVPGPTLNTLPSEMNSGSQLSVQGTAPSEDATVTIYISKNGGTPSEFSVTPDATGSFIVLGPIVQKGSYEVWAVGTSAGGILSAPSPKLSVSVSDATVLSLGSFNFSLAEMLLIFLGLSLASLLVAVLGWYKVYTYHRGRKHVVAKIQKDVHHALGVFKDDMGAHLDALESADSTRKLTAAEAKLRNDMKSNLSDLEKYIDEEVS